MADLPPWIDNDKFDSSAMLFAYQVRVKIQTEPVANLAIVEHFAPSTVSVAGMRIVPKKIPPSGTVEVPCTQSESPRCAAGMGGFQFRRYSSWYKTYVANARAGAWSLDGPIQTSVASADSASPTSSRNRHREYVVPIDSVIQAPNVTSSRRGKSIKKLKT